MPQRTPRPSEISAALAALGVYAQAPTDDELEQQAIAAGGENVLAAVLANALYGASIGCGMLAESQMLEQPTNQAQRLSHARAQALKASGAQGPGFVGAMHWQAAHIAGSLRALKDRGTCHSDKRSPRFPGPSCCSCKRCASPNPPAAQPTK